MMTMMSMMLMLAMQEWMRVCNAHHVSALGLGHDKRYCNNRDNINKISHSCNDLGH